MNLSLKQHIESAVITLLAVGVLAATPILPNLSWTKEGLIAAGLLVLRAIGKVAWSWAKQWAISRLAV